MRNTFLFLGVVFMLSSYGYAQNIRNNNFANGDEKNQLINKKAEIMQTQINNEFENGRTVLNDGNIYSNEPANGSREMWDLVLWFDAGANYHSAVATDGTYFYTANLNANSNQFCKYNLDGSNPQLFSIDGVPNATDITTDGEYYYLATYSTYVYVVNLTNQTYIRRFPVDYPGFWGGVQSIAYDPTLDDGNGGFWVGEFFNIGAVKMNGDPLITAVSAGWRTNAGFAFDPYSDPQNPTLWMLTQNTSGGAVYDKYDINTGTITTNIHNCLTDDPYGGSYYMSGGGTFTYNNGAGKFLMMASALRPTGNNTILVYELCDLALPAAPGPVTDLIATPAAAGVLNVELEWTNPVLTDEGGILTQLTAINIYENDVLIHTVSNPTIGGQETYTATVTTAGLYNYTLTAENSMGESQPTFEIVWIGHDVPAGPDNVALVKNGLTAELSWTAVTVGQHGGHFTTAGIEYDIIRYPDEITVATDLTQLSFSETINPSQQGYYFYRVVAKNNIGFGGNTDSNVGVFCEAQALPYFEGFEHNGTNFPPCWEQEYVEQKTDWEVIALSGAYEGNHVAEMRIHIINQEITKLILPPMDLSASGNYVMSFWMSPRSTHDADYLRIYYKNSADGPWILLQEYLTQFMGWDELWYKKTLALPNGTDFYFIAFESEVNAGGVYIDAISVFDARIVTGTVTEGVSTIEGAKVEIQGTNKFDFTDEYGVYDILDVEVGTFNIKATKLGYYDKVEQIFIGQGATTKDFALTKLPTHTVSGRVTSIDDPNGLEGVSVKLYGYNTYTTTTDATGNYSFGNVFGTKTYNIEARKAGYTIYNAEIGEVNSVLMHNFALIEHPSPVINPVAVDKTSNVEITWGEPLFGIPEFYRFDSGVADGQFGYSGDDAPNGIMGSSHRVNTTLVKIYWYLTNEAPIPASHVNIYIFDLDEEGMPTKNLLFSKLMVPTNVMKWSSYDLPEPLDCPNGFHMALSRPVGMYLSLGTTSPSEEWPFQYNTHFYCMNYLIYPFQPITPVNYNCNFMLRAEGYTMDGKSVSFGYPATAIINQIDESADIQPVFTTSQPVVTEEPYLNKTITPKSLLNYRVYRLMEGMEEIEFTWSPIATNVSGLSYNDNGWNSLEYGVYKWAVKAEYTADNSNEVLSLPRFTNALPKDMETTFVLNLSANSGDPVTGAVVTIKNHDGNPAHSYTVTATGATVNFLNIWKGKYDLSVTLSGFVPYNEVIDIVDNSPYPVELIEIISPVLNPIAVYEGNNVKISWQKPLPIIDTWINQCVNDVVAGRLGWGDATGGDMTAAIRFTPADLQAYEIVSGHSITKIQIGMGLQLSQINTMEIKIWEGGTSITNAGTLVYTQPVNNFSSFAELSLNEITLNTPYIIDATKELRIGYRIVNTAGYPFGADVGPYIAGKGDLIQSPAIQGGTWSEAHNVAQNWSRNFVIKAFVTNNGKNIIEETSKSLKGYEVYRLIEGASENWTLLSDAVTALNYTDNGWNALQAGHYQWAIKAKYGSGVSNAVLSNILKKEQKYNLTFFVHFKTTPIEGAAVEIAGETLYTNANGIAVFEVTNGDYTYKVTKEEYELKTGTAKVENADKNVDIELTQVSIDSIEFSNLKIYPNPFTNEINISNPEFVKSISITNATGQNVTNVIFNGKSISTEKLAIGVYFVIIEGINGEKSVNKMVKK